MDFDFSDDQEQLRDAVRKWVDKGYDFERRRKTVAAGGFDRAAYNELAADFERLFVQQGSDFERFYAHVAQIGALPKAQRHATLRAVP